MNKTKITVEDVCKYIAETTCTVREAAEHFGVGKSTIHNYCRRCDDPALKAAVKEVLDVNLSNRSYRGGRATKKRWEAMKNG